MSQPFHILVVEDDQDLRETLTEVLEGAGYTVARARDGLDALSHLGSALRRPDLILLDLQMPNMNGLEFRTVQMKQADLADIPVAILTADVRGLEEASLLKPAALLRKPVKLPQLLKLIPEVISQHASGGGE
ncbi:MAG TPA: response regulator [Polyangiaceae bacterium]|nr:response regulator [Polyangiaceae bacterium]